MAYGHNAPSCDPLIRNIFTAASNKNTLPRCQFDVTHKMKLYRFLRLLLPLKNRPI